MSIDSFKGYDASRIRDIMKMKERSLDPNRSPEERKKAEQVLERIEDQSKGPGAGYIKRKREEIRVAIANGDQRRAEKIGNEMRRIDDQYKL